MAEIGTGRIPLSVADTVLFDPSLIPPEVVEHLACETLRLVCWMLTIPKYREAIEALNAARRTARAAEGGEKGV